MQNKKEVVMKMLFKFTRYFIEVGTKNAYKITATFDEVKIDGCDIIDLHLPPNKSATVFTPEELQKFVAQASAIIYGKFADNDTPNYDLIKSFIELCEMFEIPILLNQKIYSDMP